MSSHFIRQHHSGDVPSNSGRAEPPRPAGYIKLLSDRDDRVRRSGADAPPPPALSQADGSP